MTRGWRESNWAGRAGRGLRVKVNLLIFKDEKTKDTVTYHLWCRDVAIFCHLGWDDQHLLPYIFWSLQGFPGDLARSLGEDATLTDHLQMLNEHYSMVMTFDTLFYSLKQGSWENVVQFGVHLLQQVQILQLEYPERIQQEHMEETKWDCFYEGLNHKYWCMLAYKVDGEHPASYSDLLLAAQKLKRQAEAGDPLLLKPTMTEETNFTQPQASGNLFPSKKLKGNHSFMAQSTIVKNVGSKRDSIAGPEREEEIESSVGDIDILNEVGEADQLISYIIWFANAVQLYQNKNWNCFRCNSPDHLVKDCPKDLGKFTRKEFKCERGDNKVGKPEPQKPVAAQLASLDKASRA